MRRHFIRRSCSTSARITHLEQVLRQFAQLLFQIQQFAVLAGHDFIEFPVLLLLEGGLAFEFFNAAPQVFDVHQSTSSSPGSSVGGSQSSTRLPSGSLNQPKRP